MGTTNNLVVVDGFVSRISRWNRLALSADPRVLVFAAFLMGVAVMLIQRPFRLPEIGDSANWDYMAQAIVRGQAPYRDVINIKTPGGSYLSAIAILVCRPLKLRDVMAIRMFEILLVGLLTALTYLLAAAYLRGRAVALLASAIPLMTTLPGMTADGTQPKLPMVLFGVLSLLLVAKDRPFWAGFCSMLSCLCWQPGLLFTGVGFLIFSRYLTSWRDLRALKLVIGAAAPLLAVMVYFYSRHALGDLWRWTVTYNYAVEAGEWLRDTDDAVIHILRVAVRNTKSDAVFILLGLIGFVAFAVERLRERLRRRNDPQPCDLSLDSAIIAPAVYLGFCLINFQSSADLIPLFPFIGLFAAFALARGWRFARTSRAMQRGFGASAVKHVSNSHFVLAPVIVLICAVIQRPMPGVTLQEQDRRFGVIKEALRPNDSIYVHGTVEILVLLNRPNLNPYIFLDLKKDDYIAGLRGQGFDAIIDEMESQAPKVVALSRLRKVAHRDELWRWAEEHYQQIEIAAYEGVFVRRQD